MDKSAQPKSGMTLYGREKNDCWLPRTAMTHSVHSFHSSSTTVLPYSPSVRSIGRPQSPKDADARCCEMHPFLLWFHKDQKLETQFRIFHADRQLRTLQRIYAVLTVILSVVLAFRIAEEEGKRQGTVIGLSIVTIACPISLLILSFTSHFRKFFVQASVLSGIVAAVCYVRISVWDDDFADSLAVVIYFICTYSFLLGLTTPAVLILNAAVFIIAMVDWSVEELFLDDQAKITTLFRLFVTGLIFSYFAYRQDYLFRRLFLSTFQLRVDNKDLKDEIIKMKQTDVQKLEGEGEISLKRVIYILREVRQVIISKSISGKDMPAKFDEVIDCMIRSYDTIVPHIPPSVFLCKMHSEQDIQQWLLQDLASRDPSVESIPSEFPRRASLGSIARGRRNSGTKGIGLIPLNIRPTSSLEMTSQDVASANRFLDASIDQWDFNVFTFADQCRGRPLFYLANYLFNKYNLFQKFSIDQSKFDNLLTIVENTYHIDNPYHNSTHAADVLQSTHQILVQSGLTTFFDDNEILSLLISAIVHDVDHPGRTNIFMVASESEYALIYNDKSVLENHHASTAFRMMRDPRSNILESFSKADRKMMRANIIELVLATDLSQHFDIVAKFKAKLDTDELKTAKENRMLIMKMIIKCADVSNPAKAKGIYHAWVGRIMEEFYRQGEEETRLTLPISPFMDRKTPTVEKCQCGFIDFIVKPLFDSWSNFIRDQSYAQLVDSNKKYFADLLIPPTESRPPSSQATTTPTTVSPPSTSSTTK